MKTKAQLYLAFMALIVGFDVAASFASRLLQYDYSLLAWISFCLYMLCGGLGFRQQKKLVDGLLAGMIAGLADSTLGWAASTMIHPYMPRPQPHWSLFVVATTIVFVALVGGAFGFIGAVAAKGISLLKTEHGKNQSPDSTQTKS